MSQDYTHLHSSPEEIFTAARDISRTAPAGFQRTMFLYYMTRYWVAVHEARYQEVPLQVWNEYRNAFDHFSRLMTAAGATVEEKIQNDERNSQKIESHILRALST